jgi:hypothetical protein
MQAASIQIEAAHPHPEQLACRAASPPAGGVPPDSQLKSASSASKPTRTQDTPASHAPCASPPQFLRASSSRDEQMSKVEKVAPPEYRFTMYLEFHVRPLK